LCVQARSGCTQPARVFDSAAVFATGEQEQKESTPQQDAVFKAGDDPIAEKSRRCESDSKATGGIALDSESRHGRTPGAKTRFARVFAGMTTKRIIFTRLGEPEERPALGWGHRTLVVRRAGPPRVANHETAGGAILIRHSTRPANAAPQSVRGWLGLL
jgi:hypothetical protein